MPEFLSSCMASPSISTLFTFSKKVLRNQVQYLFLVMLVTVIPFLASFLKGFNAIVQEYKDGHPSYMWPAYSDLWISLATTLLLFLFNFLFLRFYSSIGEQMISQKYQAKERKFKVNKHIDCVFKGFFYVSISCFGFFVSKGSDFFPESLGGEGSVYNAFNGYPYQLLDNQDLIRKYIMIQLGYHTFSLIQHVSREAKNDYIEMLLHHFLTVFLVGLAYFMNYVAISCIVLICHDVPDVFGYLVRALVDTNYTKLTLSAYIGLLVSWFYLRLIVLPFYLMRPILYNNPPIYSLHGIILLGAMLHFLVVLHVYWFYLFIQMGLRFLKTKATVDTYHVE